MYSYVLYYNIEKSGFNAVSAYLLLLHEMIHRNYWLIYCLLFNGLLGNYVTLYM